MININNKILIGVGISVITLILGFFGGIKYQEIKTPKFGQGFGGMRTQNGQPQQQNIQRNMRNTFRPVVGEIISQDSKSITVKMQDGSTKIVILTNDTSVNKTSSVPTTELKVGSKVGVFGNDNSDGSITAQNVQIDPMFGAFGGIGNSAPAGNPIRQK